MRHRVVISLQLTDAKKRAKALKIAVKFRGVTAASLHGGDMIEVVGDGFDPVDLTTTLKKKMGFAKLVFVAQADGMMPVMDGMNQFNWPYTTPQHQYYYPQPQIYPQDKYYVYESTPEYGGSCSVM